MRVLILGGTAFTGPFPIRRLLGAGHEVTVFHRGNHPAPPGVGEILGDKGNLGEFREEFARACPDVVLNMVCYTRADAEAFLDTFRGVARRAVVASSADVYRAFGCLHGTEPEELCAEPVPNPLGEDTPLRTRISAGGEAYDKLSVEHIVMEEPELPGTILRLPAMYGPGDHQRRLWAYLKRMDDGRPAILLQENVARWRFTHGYAEDMGVGIALAVTDDQAQGRIYNLAEQNTPTIEGRVRMIAEAAGWTGQVVLLPKDRMPEHLRSDEDMSHDMALDTSRIRSEIGYAEAVPPEEAMRRAVAWERANPPEKDMSEEFDSAAEDGALRR